MICLGRLIALLLPLFLLACMPARAGMLFADGVEVDGATVVDTGTNPARGSGGQQQAYDVLPLTFAEMDQYDQIAMEPYRATYDDLPLEEKARLYSAQFEYMNNRKPNFHPSTFGVAEEEDEEDDDEFESDEGEYEEWAEEEPEQLVGNGGPYDPLPMFFVEMDQYDQIAMEPYREKYDGMPVAEKARLYGRQFEFMHGREPNFDPAVLNAVRRAATESRSTYAAKTFLYKPATPKPPRPQKKSEEEQAGEVLETLPGPWESMREAEPEVVEEMVEPRRQGYRVDERRMETLRQGWNAIDVIRGARER